jgi:hypothetical protein
MHHRRKWGIYFPQTDVPREQHAIPRVGHVPIGEGGRIRREKENGQKKREKGKEKSHEHRPFNTNTPWNPTDCLSIEIKLYAPLEGFIQ